MQVSLWKTFAVAQTISNLLKNFVSGMTVSSHMDAILIDP